MNSRVENFAFWMAIFFMILLPVIWIFVPVTAQLYGMDKEVVETMTVAVVFASGILFPILCIVCSCWIESNHFKLLAEQEKELADMTVSDMRTLPPNWKAENAVFVSESVVIANDYLKSFFWFVRKLIGGRSQSLGRLVERARREATVRLLKKAREQGANVVWNVRFETTIVQFNSGGNKNAMAGVECYAYGTAMLVKND